MDSNPSGGTGRGTGEGLTIEGLAREKQREEVGTTTQEVGIEIIAVAIGFEGKGWVP